MLRSLCLNFALPAVIGLSVAVVVWRRSHAPPPPKLEQISAETLLAHAAVSDQQNEKVVLVEFGDLQCPACAMVNPMVREVVQRRHLGYVFRNFPLTSIHPFARPLAIRTLALPPEARLAEMAKVWEQPLPPTEELGKQIQKLPADSRVAAETLLDRDVAIATSLGLHATPTFYICLNGREVWRLFTVGQVEEFLDERRL